MFMIIVVVYKESITVMTDREITAPASA